MRLEQVNVTNCDEAFRALGASKHLLRLGPNTVLHRTITGAAVSHHRTQVVTYSLASGVIELRADGWVTQSTQQIINRFTPSTIRCELRRSAVGAASFRIIDAAGSFIWDGHGSFFAQSIKHEGENDHDNR